MALVFGERMAHGEVMGRVETLLGADTARTVREMVERASEPRSGVIATLIGLGMSALGASSVFGQLQRALNDIWDAMLLLVAFLLLVSLGAGAALTALSERIAALFPGAAAASRTADVVISLLVTSLLFAALFKVLPDADIRWSDVAVGAVFTAVLFSVGRLGIAYYLGRTSGASVYGAAGSLVASCSGSTTPRSSSSSAPSSRRSTRGGTARCGRTARPGRYLPRPRPGSSAE